MNCDLINIQEASNWASSFLKKDVTTANISYLINYGRISKFVHNGIVLISQKELQEYYEQYKNTRQIDWQVKLGNDINWALSFENIKESETTKHVHRLHPYKGKFIPQLVEYFLDSHTDEFKREVYFKKGDTILDPFCGSGTTLVEANELGINAIGIDISAFNSLISNCKIAKYDIIELNNTINNITENLQKLYDRENIAAFDKELTFALKEFNNTNFPVPEFKRNIRLKLIDGNKYGDEKAEQFLPIFYSLIEKYNIDLLNTSADNFIDRWFIKNIKNELNFVFEQIKSVKNIRIKKLLCVILSRTMRSCRATTHADLATLISPVFTTYYCSKHGKICKPIFSILKWWKKYSSDTINRVLAFDNVRTDTIQYCLTGDSQTINIYKDLVNTVPDLCEKISQNKIQGIFTSPPYVGLIDYHEQHAYAYDLFGFERHDDLEIGSMSCGQGKTARENYAEAIANVLINCKKYLSDNYNVFIVANDKYNLYPQIAEKADMQIIKKYNRPVLNRTEKDKNAYSETIFHLKEK